MRPTRIEVLRELSFGGDIVVKEGDLVSPETVIVRLRYLPGNLRRLRVAQDLKVPPQRLPELMLKAVGEKVDEGDLLAARSVGWDLAEFRSPVSGYLTLVSQRLGFAYIREPILIGDGRPVQVDVTNQLGVPPRTINRHLVVGPSKVVPAGSIIASFRKSRHVHSTSVVAPIYGKITEIDADSGTITLTPIFSSTEITAQFEGRVTAVRPGEGVVIEAQGYDVRGAYGVGGQAFGPLRVAVSSPDATLQASALKPADAGSVLVGGKTATLEALREAARIGAAAVIVSYLGQETLTAFVGEEEMGLGITGEEDIPFTVILLDGFLPAPFDEEIFAVLKAGEGQVASVDGTTHIRAGVLRPRVFIPVASGPGVGTAVNPEVTQPLTAGCRVKITREPFQGISGRVTAMGRSLEPIETGAQVLLADVELEGGGQKVRVPKQNLVVMAGRR